MAAIQLNFYWPCGRSAIVRSRKPSEKRTIPHHYIGECVYLASQSLVFPKLDHFKLFAFIRDVEFDTVVEFAFISRSAMTSHPSNLQKYYKNKMRNAQYSEIIIIPIDDKEESKKTYLRVWNIRNRVIVSSPIHRVHRVNICISCFRGDIFAQAFCLCMNGRAWWMNREMMISHQKRGRRGKGWEKQYNAT